MRAETFSYDIEKKIISFSPHSVDGEVGVYPSLSISCSSLKDFSVFTAGFIFGMRSRKLVRVWGVELFGGRSLLLFPIGKFNDIEMTTSPETREIEIYNPLGMLKGSLAKEILSVSRGILEVERVSV